MKKYIIIIYTVLSTSITTAFAQLPPAAQALYDSVYAQDSILVNLALTNGAQVLATPDGNSFYLQWFPAGATPNTTPLIVTLHGSECSAFMEFKSWHQQALQHGIGIMALQWYRYRPDPPYDYFPDDTLYSYFNSALTTINYPSGKALLHGFSRGSARSYAIIFKDIQSGNNYFCTSISNSGGADINYPLYDSINTGLYGPNVFTGKHWNLFCGGQDTIVGCAKMTITKTWLQGLGATVDIFIQDPALGHDGFQLPSSFAYKDSILDNYLSCYNGTLSAGEELRKTAITIFPNPFTSQTTLQMGDRFNDATLKVYNSFGQTVKETNKLSGHLFIFYRDNLPSGLYFFRLLQDNKIILADKFVIVDN